MSLRGQRDLLWNLQRDHVIWIDGSRPSLPPNTHFTYYSPLWGRSILSLLILILLILSYLWEFRVFFLFSSPFRISDTYLNFLAKHWQLTAIAGFIAGRTHAPQS